jgi:hypothetical protein
MAAWPIPPFRSMKNPRRKTHALPTPQNLTARSLRFEPFEERILFAINPHLVAILPSPATALTPDQVLHSAPTELTFRFDSDIDPNSLFTNPSQPAIQLRRAGPDGALNTNDDPLVVPSYMAIGDHANEVVVRFAQASARVPFTLPDGTLLDPNNPLFDPTMPDDVYQIRIVGSGPTPLKGINGAPFLSGTGSPDFTQKFTLDLGAQVVSVVPQPVTRVGNLLTQATDRIVVYFNADDPLDSTSAMTKTNYELIRTTDGTEHPTPQSIINPTGVVYDAGKATATLTFAPGILAVAGVYRLRVGNSEPLPLATQDLGGGFAGSSLTSARVLGTQFPILQGTQSISVSGNIGGSSVNVAYPGSDAEPGMRNINTENHIYLTPERDGSVQVYTYNFQQVIGQVFGSDSFNSITEAQKQRVREVFSYYAQYLGVEFVETANSGLTIATGDTRVILPDQPVDTIGGAVRIGSFNPMVVINAANNWGNSEAGGAYFVEAMADIGKLLGMGYTAEAPGSNALGSAPPLGDSAPAEPIFPGNTDILLGQYMHPPVGNDVQMYKFALPRAGQLNLETLAERLPSLNPSSPVLDSVISVFDSNGKLIARNDDYYGKDSFLQLQLASGTYYVAVTSTGNTNFDPTIANTGFGGTTEGQYKLTMTFTPTPNAGIRDTSGTLLDGDSDGAPGGTFNFWFRVASPDTTSVVNTIFVDKASTQTTGLAGSISHPYTTIADALAHASDGDVVRIVGNGGADGNLATVSDNLSYNIGFDNLNNPLSDGSTFEIPKGVTVMIDAGTIIKLRGANIDVGSSAQGIDRSSGALQILGTVTGQRTTANTGNTLDPALTDDAGSVFFTSYYNSQIGKDAGTAKDSAASPGNWGGLVFRDDPGLAQPGDIDLEAAGVFLNSVNHANLSYGGGKVTVNSVEAAFAPIHLVTSRPSVSFNIISRSADAAVSADPNSFQESEFQSAQFAYDYTRSGPKIHGNTLSDNSLNGLFVRVSTATPPSANPDLAQPQGNGEFLNPLTVSARFSTTDMPYIIKENLLIAGSPGGAIIDQTGFHTRPAARLAIDPGVIVKIGGARIETQMGAQLIAEGTAARPIIFTSTFDDRYGAGGSFDTTNDNKATSTHTSANEGDWGGIFFGPLSVGSLDHTLITFAGGSTTIEGGFAAFNPVEIHSAQVRIANSTLEHNGSGPVDPNSRDDRNGRSWSTPAVIFVRGAQPVLINNIIQNNDTAPLTDPNALLKNTAAISIDVNSLNSTQVTDWGRSTGFANIQVPTLTNTGPLIRGNQIGNTPINGLLVRGGTISTNVIWDDTDIVHVLEDEVIAGNQFSVNGTIRLQSTSTESLVVKLLGTNAGFTASGTPLDINDRIGGTVQLVGQPNHPVILTSLFDDTVGAGFTPSGLVQSDTHNVKSANSPTLPSTSGPVFLDGGDRDDHGFRNNDGNQNGWKFIQQALNFANTNSLNAAGAGILAIGVQQDQGTPTQAEKAIKAAADALGLSLTIVTGADISTVNFSQFKLIYVPSDAGDTLGGISDADIALLAARKLDIQNYVNTVGGGLVALTEDFAAAPLSWLELPQAFTIAHTGGVDLTQTPLLAAAGFNITDQELSLGTPWHNSFVGPSGFNRLQPWVVDPDTGAVVTLGLGPGQGGIGPRASNASPGDWRSVKLDTFSNDTNVDVLNEIEQGFAPTGDTNSLPTTAQFLGTLAKDNKSGDDNQRLGFEVHGSISQAVSSPNFGDVDVYSFKGTAGTAVWFDIDRTSSSLDTVVELIDANGSVIARSDNSLNETQNPNLLVGLAKPLQVVSASGMSPFSNPDFYSTNPLDAGMRVDLPGTAGSVNTYFVRVRASSQDLTRLNGGLTKGSYQMQIRLQETDLFPGSVVRNADIRFAATGVDVIGKPEHSPLLGDTGETTLVHNTLPTAQDLGNLLTSDTNSVSVAGNLAAGDVDWYKLNLNYDLVTSFGALPDTARFFPTLFQINYADGLARPDTTLSIFDKNGNLIYIGRDSDNPDSEPRSSLGSDTANTSHGSFGTLDPTIGTVELPAGSPSDIGSTTGAGFTYYVAVSASNMLPTVLNATFKLNATNPTVRLQPLNSVTRIFDDSIGAGGQQAFPGTTGPQLNTAATPYTLADVVGFVNTSFGLYTFNPFTGQYQTTVAGNGRPNLGLPGTFGNPDRGYDDMAMRWDGRLMTFPVSTNGSAAVNGTYTQIDTGTGSTVTSTQGGLAGGTTFSISDVDPNQPITQAAGTTPATYNFISSVGNFGIAIQGMSFTKNEGFFFNGSSSGSVINGGRTLYVVGNRNAGNGTIPETQNLLFRLDPDTGAAFSFDLESNTTFHSGQPTFQPFPDPINHPEGPGSGTQVIPRGALTTGTVMIAKAATDPVSAFSSTGALNDIVDGATFLITVPGATTPTTRRFEFESGPQLNLDNPSIPGTNGVAALRNGLQFLITGAGSVPNTTQPINFQLTSGPVLNAVGSGSGLLGQTFSIEDNQFHNLTFEFGTAGSVGAGHVPVAIGSSAAATAANIVTAINVTAKTINPNYVVQAALPSVGSTRVTLINDLQDDAAVNTSGAPGISKQGDWDQLPGNVPIFFEETDSVTTFGNEMAAGVKAAFDAVGSSVNASFARDRITFLGAASADFSAFPAASPEFSTQGAGGIGGGNRVMIRFNAADTQDQIAAAIALAINTASIPGRTIVGYPTASPVTATIVNGTVNLKGAQFSTDFANAISLGLRTDGAGTIGGLAFLPNSTNTQFNGGDDLYAVSSTGALYKVNDYSEDNGATLQLLNVFTDQFGRGVQFTGLSAGPPDVENGRYARTLFATDFNGNIWAFDDQGNPAPIFVNGATHVNLITAFGQSTGFVSGGSFFLEGIAFSSLDYNLWHATTTEGNNPNVVPPNSDPGNTSFYFGLERAGNGAANPGYGGNFNDLPSQFWQPGALDYTPFNLTGGALSAANAALLSSYNLPGGALGSLTTTEFDLSNYTAGDKPTLYFDYSADTEDANLTGTFMRDSFRVFASSDGAKWEQLATNNSVLNAELPPVPSVNGGQYEGDRANQQVQELFDPTGKPSLLTDRIPGSATTVQGWRQARIDLGDFAGKSHIQIRFDFSTAGSMGIGAPLQGGVYLAGVEGTKLQDGQQFVIDNSVVTGFGTTTGPTSTVTNHTFTFRSGFILQAPAGGGKAITSGETFTVNGKTYEFLKNTALLNGVLLADGNVLVSISDNLTPEGVAASILNAMTVNPVTGVTPVAVADRVQLQAATSISQSAGHALIVQGGALPATLARTDVPYLISMSAADVAMEVAKALDRQFTFVNGNVDDPTVLTTAKVNGRTIRLYGHNVVNPGPLPYSNTLPGDDQGQFYSPQVYDIPAGELVLTNIDAAQRGENNAHQGVFIDNLIVGFAGRGEQVLNAQVPPPVIDPNNPPDPNAPPPLTVVSTFDTLPVDTSGGARIKTGPYQLSIRRGSEYLPGALIPGNTTQFAPGQTTDINDRLASGITIYAIPASRLIDGQTFSIAVESGLFTFEFDSGNGLTSPTNIAVPIHAGDDALAVAFSIRNAINNVASSAFGVKAGLNNNSMVSGQTRVAINLYGAADVLTGPLTKRVFGPNLLFSNLVLPVVGDASPVRIQGQTIIQGTQISSTLQTGISVRPEFGETNELGQPTIGSAGHTGTVANLPTLNNAQLVPGVTIKDNLIVQGGLTGILFSGSPATDIAHAVPFGRIINNSIVGTPTGIKVTDNASPTILNNIVAQSTKVAISVDNTSTTTIVGANLYQGNAKNLVGVAETNAIVLQPTDPLFVDTTKRNFYLKQNSLAIDSSVNSLQERAAMQAVEAPLGIAPSQIQAPDFDLLGQLRIDDPTVASPAGLGSNVFKDRGAIERADVLGPSAALRNPIDNDAAALDRNVALNKVTLVGRQLSEFTIQLNDAGIGVDASTVDASKFVVQRTVGTTTETLKPGDYTVGFDDTNMIARLVAASGLWSYGTYTITLDRSATTGIKDVAGNLLQPNNSTGATQFVIQETPTAISPWQNQLNPFDVNASGSVSGLDALLVINRLLLGQSGPLPAVVSVPPYVDVNGDGSLSALDALAVINYLTTHQAAAPQAQPLVTTQIVSAAPTAAPMTIAAAAPSAEPAAASDGVVTGLAIARMSTAGDEAADAVASSVSYAPANGESQATAGARGSSAAAVTAAFATDSLDESDSDFDDVLSDLAEDTCQLQASV